MGKKTTIIRYLISFTEFVLVFNRKYVYLCVRTYTVDMFIGFSSPKQSKKFLVRLTSLWLPYITAMYINIGLLLSKDQVPFLICKGRVFMIGKTDIFHSSYIFHLNAVQLDFLLVYLYSLSLIIQEKYIHTQTDFYTQTHTCRCTATHICTVYTQYTVDIRTREHKHAYY